jgi:hypothetical protein
MKLHFLLAFLLLWITPAFAQEPNPTQTLTDEEMALVEQIQAVFSELNSLPFTDQTLNEIYDQVTVYEGETIYQTKESILSGVIFREDEVVTAIDAEILEVNSQDDLSWTIGLSLIFVDDELYLNITESDGYYAPGWLKLSDHPEIQDIVGTVDIQSFFNDEYQFSAQDVGTIEAIDVPETVEADRAILVHFAPESLDAESLIAWYLTGIWQDISAEELDAMIAQVPHEMALHTTYYFNADGQLIETASVMNFSANFADIFEVGEFDLTQELYSTVRYAYPEETPIITAPELD